MKPSEQKPWLQFFTEEAKQAQLPKESIYQHLVKVNQGNLDSIAINYFQNQIPYGKLIEDIDQCAAAFAALGVKKGDIVTFSSITVPELVVSLYALNKLGAAAMVLDPRNTAGTVANFMKNANSRLLLILDAAPNIKSLLLSKEVHAQAEFMVVYSIRNSMPGGIMKFLAGLKFPDRTPYDEHVLRWSTFMNLGKGVDVPTVDYSEFELAGIALTGGTTGAPKGVMFTNDGFNAVALDFEYCGVQYDHTHRFMNIIPAFASYGMVASLHMPLSLGLEMIIIPKFDSDSVGKYIKQYRPQHTLMVPAHYEKLMNSKEMKDGFMLDFFITAGSGGDTMNAGLEAKLNGFLKERGAMFPLSQGYGMSEVSSAACCSCNGNFRSLSVGYPLLMNTMGIFKPGTTEELGYNEEGEICITGPALMMGYLNNPAETENVIFTHPDGTRWVHSGDIGTMDEDGFIYIKGRIKRMIVMHNGHKVFPTHIESVLGKHKDVLSCAVVGVKDRAHAQGQKVLAVVQLKADRVKDEITAELQELMHSEIEASVIPDTIEYIPDMPHTGMGKIDYRKLAKDYDAKLDEAVAAAQ